MTFREKMPVYSARAYRSPAGISVYPICPRCQNTIEREYQCFCDRCGQALDWESFDRALVIL